LKIQKADMKQKRRAQFYQSVVEKFKTQDLSGEQAEAYIFLHPDATRLKRGRPQTYSSTADKQRAYRERMRNQGQVSSVTKSSENADLDPSNKGLMEPMRPQASP
jgi:hypothetical protein